MISETEWETGPIDGTTSLSASISDPAIPTLPFFDTLWPVGLNPHIPQKEDGILIEPAESEQNPNGEH